MYRTFNFSESCLKQLSSSLNRREKVVGFFFLFFVLFFLLLFFYFYRRKKYLQSAVRKSNHLCGTQSSETFEWSGILSFNLSPFPRNCISFLCQRKILLIQVKLSHKIRAYNISSTNLPSLCFYFFPPSYTSTIPDLCINVLVWEAVFPRPRNRC